MKKFLSVLSIVILAITMNVAISLADYEEKPDTTVMYCIVNPNSYVNIRYEPSKRSSICGMLYFGDDIEVVNIKGEWAYCRCVTECEYGYVKASYLSEYKPEIVNKNMIVKSNGRVALRTYKNGDRCRWLKNGNELDIYCIVGDWAITSKNWRFIKTEFLVDKE